MLCVRFSHLAGECHISSLRGGIFRITLIRQKANAGEIFYFVTDNDLHEKTKPTRGQMHNECVRTNNMRTPFHTQTGIYG